MNGRRRTLLNLLGFEIRFDLTWLILLALIVWTLSAGYFPATYADLPLTTYVAMAVVAAAGIVVSIVLHELAHSLVGRRLGMEIKGITLFALGGAAEMAEEPGTPRGEFLMAIAGPAMSVLLAGAFHALYLGLEAAGAPLPLAAVFRYLAGINLILAIFNMVPAYPLDGGRVLRAALWAWRRDPIWATRIASTVGGVFGLFLVLMGVLEVVGGNLVGGMWLFLIGLFLRAAASHGYRALLTRQSLAGVPVRRFMSRDPVAAPADLPLPRLIDDFILGRCLEIVPVVEGDRLLGEVTLARLRTLSPEQRAGRGVRDALASRSPENTVTPDTDTAQALALMQRTGNGRLLVAEGDRLVGVLSLEHLLKYLTLMSALDLRPEDTAAEKERRHAA